MEDTKGYYSPDEVAALLGLHVRTIRRFIRDGKLKAARIGKQYRITSEELSAFVGARGQAPPLPARRQRRAVVSTTVDVDAIDPDAAQRVITMLTAAFGAARAGPGTRRMECIYYEERGALRIIVNADLGMTTAVLGFISGLIESI